MKSSFGPRESLVPSRNSSDQARPTDSHLPGFQGSWLVYLPGPPTSAPGIASDGINEFRDPGDQLPFLSHGGTAEDRGGS